jgi:hypothetical protein
MRKMESLEGSCDLRSVGFRGDSIRVNEIANFTSEFEAGPLWVMTTCNMIGHQRFGGT